MADQNNSQVVTINDAIAQVKKWAAEKNFEQVKEGCEEILQVEPDNKEVKGLLDEALKALLPQPIAAAAPVVPQAPVQTPAPAPAAPIAPVEPIKPAVSITPTPAAQTATAPIVNPVPAAQPTPADIFKKTTEPLKKEEIKTEIKTSETKSKEVIKESKSAEKSGKLGTIITIAVFAALLGGFVYSFIQGWLNPFYDWILGLFGL